MKLLRIEGLLECSIVERLNRFVVLVEHKGRILASHINNTGRLTGLLSRGRRAYCIPRSGGKTRLRLVAIECTGYSRAALVDTLLQMRGFEEAVSRGLISWLRGCRVLRRNPWVGASRLDYLLDCRGRMVFVEAKSAVLRLPGNTAAYPDPASPRGRRHVSELASLAEKGLDSIIVFIAAIPGARRFRVYSEADPKLPELIEEAIRKGVIVKAIGMSFEPTTSYVMLEKDDLPVILR